MRPFSSSGISTLAQNAETLGQSPHIDPVIQEDKSPTISPSNGRVMLIDGTAIMYRAYYKLIGMYKVISGSFYLRCLGNIYHAMFSLVINFGPMDVHI